MPIAPRLHVANPRNTKEGAQDVNFGAAEGTSTLRDISGGRMLGLERGTMRWKSESKAVLMSLLPGPSFRENCICLRNNLSANQANMPSRPPLS
jgi:hypothetical protein